ncbi:MAG: triose-phosphate isomerase [Pseudobdellovibrionaceae bacterium]
MKKIFAANWKLHKNPQETRQFFTEWKKQWNTSSQDEVVFFPPATNLEATAQALDGTSLRWGSQNCYSEVKGAFTGEISAQTVKDLGGQYVLIGHSERRSLFLEKDNLIAKKVALAQKLDLIPLLCIGETLGERESGRTLYILRSQLEEGLSQADSMKRLVIAYEPVWAIGTGKVANNDQVKEAHKEVNSLLQSLGFPGATPILYGGSVKAENAKELVSIPHVNGFLVGGASLEVPSFLQICRSNS